MPVKLYKMDLSPPARAAMMACDIFGVTADMIEVNLLEREHCSPEFLKKNPVHTVPVLEDGELIIHDSHAILQYLADAYGKNDSMYPKDVKKRALVNQKLFFDTSILFPRLRNITYAAIIEGERKVPQKKIDEIIEAYDFVEEFLSRTKYLAGDTMTIADVAAFASVTSLMYLHPLDESKWPKTNAWIKEMRNLPFTKKYNEPGLQILGDWIKKSVEL